MNHPLLDKPIRVFTGADDNEPCVYGGPDYPVTLRYVSDSHIVVEAVCEPGVFHLIPMHTIREVDTHTTKTKQELNK